jgi:hypothetical protein
LAAAITTSWKLAEADSICFLLAGTSLISPAPVRRRRFRELVTGRPAGQVTYRLSFAFKVGLVVGLICGLIFGLADGLGAGLTHGLGIGLVVAVATLFSYNVEWRLPLSPADSSPRANKPGDIIRADARYWLTSALVVAPLFGFLFGYGAGAGLTGVLVVGLTSWLTFWLTGGATKIGDKLHSCAWTRYYAAVIVNAARHRGPLRFGAFLDWAHQAGLLRVSGIAYQFRHRQLQDWLTSPLQAGQPEPGPGKPASN